MKEMLNNMERIDIKLFKAQSKVKVIMGKLIKQIDILEEKEIEFYNISIADIKKMKQIDDNIEMFFDLIPVLSNVDMTISKEEFKEMCNKPSLIFINYINSLMEHITDIYTTMSQLSNATSKINSFNLDNKIDLDKIKEIQELEKIKTKEELQKEIGELYENMKIDKENRLEYLSEIDVLEEELSKLEVVKND
jgi:hypothetical protein